MQPTHEVFGQFAGKASEIYGIWTEANQKALQGLVEFSTGAVREGARLVSELQDASVEAFKEGQATWLRRQAGIAEVPKDPFAWYQRALVDGMEQTQKAFKFIEGNAQAITKAAERVQAKAEQAGKEIQQAFTVVAEKVKGSYTPPQN